MIVATPTQGSDRAWEGAKRPPVGRLGRYPAMPGSKEEARRLAAVLDKAKSSYLFTACGKENLQISAIDRNVTCLKIDRRSLACTDSSFANLQQGRYDTNKHNCTSKLA